MLPCPPEPRASPVLVLYHRRRIMNNPYVHNLADQTLRPAGFNGAMRSRTQTRRTISASPVSKDLHHI